MKRIKFDQNFKREGLPMTSVREINILLTMDHPNIVNVSEVVTAKPANKQGPMDVYMVMEYVQLDLKKFLDTYKAKLKVGEVWPLLVSTSTWCLSWPLAYTRFVFNSEFVVFKRHVSRNVTYSHISLYRSPVTQQKSTGIA